jgi:hypothetical protein
VVTLPTGQQRVLDRIETDLEKGEPRLRSMFAIFTRLTRDDGAPRTEALCPRRRLAGRARPLIATAVLVGLIILAAFMAMSSSAAHTCRPAPGVHGAASTATCQSAPLAPVRP